MNSYVNKDEWAASSDVSIPEQTLSKKELLTRPLEGEKGPPLLELRLLLRGEISAVGQGKPVAAFYCCC